MKSSIGSQNLRFYILSILFVVVVSLVLYFGINILNNRESSFRSDQEQLNFLTSEELLVPTLAEDYKLISEDLSIVEDALPESSDIIDFVERIEQISEDLGVKSKINLQQGSIVEGGVEVDNISETSQFLNRYLKIKSVQTLEIGVSLRGGYSKVMNFIATIEKLPYFFHITSIRSNTIADEDTGEADLSTVITLNLYVKNADAE